MAEAFPDASSLWHCGELDCLAEGTGSGAGRYAGWLAGLSGGALQLDGVLLSTEHSLVRAACRPSAALLAVHDIVVGAANQHMEAVVRGGLLSLPTEYLPVVVAAGSYYVHPHDIVAIGAGDWNRGLQFLSAMVAEAAEPA